MTKINRFDEERMLPFLNPMHFLSFQSPSHSFHPTESTAISSCQKSSGATAATRPQLDQPSRIDLQKLEEGTKELKSIFADDEGNTIDVEDLLHKILLEYTAESTERLSTQKQWLELERKWMDNDEKTRSVVLDKHIEGLQSAASWGTVAKSLASFGLIASGMAGLAATTVAGAAVVAPGLAIGSIVAGTCLALDQLLDDKAKKLVASWMARGNQERQEIWLDRIHFFCAAVSCALSFGLKADVAVQIALNVSKTAVTATQTIVEYRTSRNKALLIELDAACRIAQKNVENTMNSLQDTCSTIYQYYENIHHIEDNRTKLARLMLNFGDI